MKGNSHGHSWFHHTLNSATGGYKIYSFPLVSTSSTQSRQAPSMSPPASLTPVFVQRYGEVAALGATAHSSSCWAGPQLWYCLSKSRHRLKVQNPTHLGLQLRKRQHLLIAMNYAFFRTFLQRARAVSRTTTLRTISDICFPKYFVHDKIKRSSQRSNILHTK